MTVSDSAQRFVQRLPVVFTGALLLVGWILFIVFVSIKQVLLERKQGWRFLGHMVIFNALGFATVIAFIAAVSSHPVAPDQSFAPADARPLRPDEVRQPGPVDDDDIPLRLLRSARHRERSEQRPDEEEEGLEDEALLKNEENDTDNTVIMAKTATGGPRWCRKCDGWKPDRCHHCRSCMQCVLKMDHHCPWINNCVGYHNYKPFVLFLTYCTLFCAFGAWQAGYEVYHFLRDPIDFGRSKEASSHVDNMDDLRVALLPVVWMLLTLLGGIFGLAVGILGGYHWYLLLNNRTTLEHMNRTVPTALLDPGTRAVLEELGPRGTSNRLPGAWRPDHILTRPERTRLRSEAREINVYDLGWKRNLRSVLCGDGVPPLHTFRDLVKDVGRGLWPLSRPRQRHYGAGHFFEHDPAALQQLKALTSEMRLGIEGVAAPQQRSNDLGEWTIGRSDSESDSE